MINRIALLTVMILMGGALMSGATEIKVGAARTDIYVPMLKDKRVALLSNHTGMIGDTHTLDMMLDHGIDVTTIFSPEHGFRGTADAGEKVNNSIDQATGIPIASLYAGAGSRTPSDEVMERFDVIVCDLQDVGLRFYTYYITMLDLMDAAARAGKEFIVFDRPNPNGMTVDGPILDMSLSSGVGRLPIPVIHGLTLGEMAKMIVGENWLPSNKKLALTVVPCEGYTHSTHYKLPVAPSPNLPDMQAIYLYPSTCLFEGTVMSLGRGTDTPFCVYGHPFMSGCDYSFTPRSRSGAKNPPLKNRLCHGRTLCRIPTDTIIARGLDLTYVIDAYSNPGMKKAPKFFSSFFDKLIGNRKVRQMITDGLTARQIKESWSDDVKRFTALRNKYLLYPL